MIFVKYIDKNYYISKFCVNLPLHGNIVLLVERCHESKYHVPPFFMFVIHNLQKASPNSHVSSLEYTIWLDKFQQIVSGKENSLCQSNKIITEKAKSPLQGLHYISSKNYYTSLLLQGDCFIRQYILGEILCVQKFRFILP